jgi:anti-sigma B factor antagonist
MCYSEDACDCVNYSNGVLSTMALANKSLLNAGISEVKGSYVVTVAGECDMSTAPQLKDVLFSAVRASQDNPPRLVVDFREVTYLDSCVYWVLASVGKKIAEKGGSAVLVVGAGQPIRRAVKLLQIERLMNLYPGIDEALESIA